MSFYSDITYVSLTGSQPAIRRMLNAVIAHLEAEQPVLDTDGPEEIMRKLTAADGRGFRIALPDLLDDEALQDSLVQRKKQLFSEMPEESGCCDWTDDRMFNIIKLTEESGRYTVELSIYEAEDFCYFDFVNYADLVRLFGCTVRLEDHLYNKAAYIGIDSIFTYEPDDGKVLRTVVCYEPDGTERSRTVEYEPDIPHELMSRQHTDDFVLPF